MVSLLAAAVLMVSPADPPAPVPRAAVRQGVLDGREGGGVLSF